MTIVQSYVMLVLRNVTMEPLNVIKKNKGTTEYDNNMIIYIYIYIFFFFFGKKDDALRTKQEQPI